MTAMRALMSRLKLTVKETKTRLCRGPDEPFNFLGYTIGRCYWLKTGRAYIGVRPSDKKIQGLFREIQRVHRAAVAVAGAGGVGRASEPLTAGLGELLLPGDRHSGLSGRWTAHACHRLRQWLVRKLQGAGVEMVTLSDRYLHEDAGPDPAPAASARPSWAKA